MHASKSGTWRAGAAASITNTIFFQRSRGSVSRRIVSIAVRGKGRVRVRAKGLRVGEVVQDIAID